MQSLEIEICGILKTRNARVRNIKRPGSRSGHGHWRWDRPAGGGGEPIFVCIFFVSSIKIRQNFPGALRAPYFVCIFFAFPIKYPPKHPACIVHPPTGGSWSLDFALFNAKSVFPELRTCVMQGCVISKRRDRDRPSVWEGV